MGQSYLMCDSNELNYLSDLSWKRGAANLANSNNLKDLNYVNHLHYKKGEVCQLKEWNQSTRCKLFTLLKWFNIFKWSLVCDSNVLNHLNWKRGICKFK